VSGRRQRRAEARSAEARRAYTGRGAQASAEARRAYTLGSPSAPLPTPQCASSTLLEHVPLSGQCSAECQVQRIVQRMPVAPSAQ
jgi:hypothetical protein